VWGVSDIGNIACMYSMKEMRLDMATVETGMNTQLEYRTSKIKSNIFEFHCVFIQTVCTLSPYADTQKLHVHTS
jgi:hypothetical protein